jgi:cell division septation protein DedD
MNDKKDDSKGRTDLLDDTASLLESLFKDTKSSQIKVVRRRIRPKSGVKKRVISKQRIDEGKKSSQTPFRKQDRPSPSQKSAGVTKSKIISRKRPLPGSILPKDSKTERNRQRLRRPSIADDKSTSKSGKSGEKRITRPRDLKQEKPFSKIIAGSDEERTESLDQSVLNSMISMASGIKGSRKSPPHERSPEERQLLKTKERGGEETSGAEDLQTGAPADIEEISGTDEEITEVMEKATLDSMISELEGSGKEGDEKASVKKSHVPEEDEEITEVMEKTTIDSMISTLEGSGKEEDEKESDEESPVPEEEEAGVEIFFDSEDQKGETFSDIEGITKSDEEIMEVLEKSALSTMISTLEGSGKQGDDRVSAEKSSLSEEVETSDGIVVDSDDLKEEVSADTEGIDRATEEDTLSQEKPAAPSSITIEDTLLEARAHEAYPESGIEEKPIPEDREEVVEEARQAVDLKEEEPSDSENAELVEEKSLSEEKPAVSTPILSKIPETEADVFEVHHILEDKEGSILEDKKGIERSSGAVGLETEPLSESSGPAKEEPRFQETPVPSLMSSEDSEVSTDEEEHYRLAAEEEPVPKGEEDDIERISEPAESGKDELAGPEEGVALTEEELQVIERSGRRSKVIRIGLPLVLFGILAVILSIKYSPLDFFRREQAQKPVSDRSVEVSSPKKQEVSQEPMNKSAPTTRQRNQPSTRASGEKEIVRAPVPKKRDAAPDTQVETVAAVTPKVQPSSSEPPTILAMKESVEESSPIEQRKTPKTSKETFAATDQKVQPEPPGPITSPPPSDIAAKAEANQKEISISYPYSVYLGSYGTPERMEKAVSKYKENGLSFLHWQEVDLGDKGIWYRVFAGQFETKSEAEAYIRERQLVDAEVRKTERGASKGSVSVKGAAPQAKAPEKKRLLPEATAGSSYPYSVYVGSYKDPDRARKAASDLQTKGPSFWVKIDLGDKGIWYRVYTGCFQTRDQAETFIKDHQIVDGESRQTTYANLIGTYSSEEELDRMRLSLLNLEFSPYVIEASGGQSHLFTGAFYQKANAEKEQLDLKAKGIQSQLVKR